MKVLKIVLVLVLTLGLVAASAFTVVAKSEEKGKPPAVARMAFDVRRGEVISIDVAKLSFVVKEGNKDFNIVTDKDTKFFKLRVPQGPGNLWRGQAKFRAGPGLIPGRGKGIGRPVPPPNLLSDNVTPRPVPPRHPLSENATFSDLSVGDRVDVRVEKGTNLAKVVLIFGKPTVQSIKGTITALDTAQKKITITSDNGTAVTLNYDDQTVFTLRGSLAVAVGQKVHAVYRIKDMLAKTVNILPPVAPAPPVAPTRPA